METPHAVKQRDVRPPAYCLRRPQRLNRVAKTRPFPANIQVVEASVAPPDERSCFRLRRNCDENERNREYY